MKTEPKKVLVSRTHVFDVLRASGFSVHVQDPDKYRKGMCDFVFEIDESKDLCGCRDSSGCPSHPL